MAHKCDRGLVPEKTRSSNKNVSYFLTCDSNEPVRDYTFRSSHSSLYDIILIDDNIKLCCYVIVQYEVIFSTIFNSRRYKEVKMSTELSYPLPNLSSCKINLCIPENAKNQKNMYQNYVK